MAASRIPGGFAIALITAAFAQVALAADDHAKAEEIVQGKCLICHGAEGENSTPAFPRLAGQSATYVTRQLAYFKSGRRKSSTMAPMVEDLGPEEFRLLGAYFGSRKTVGHPVEDKDLAQVGRFVYVRGNPYSGVAACASCHGKDGHGADKLPRLAGQHAQYLENQLKQFDRRERTNDNAVMHGIASKMNELEIKAVSAYLSGLE